MLPRSIDAAPNGPEEDGAIFARLRGGDSTALEALFHRYVNRLCSFAFAYVDSRDSAEEIVQELFVWLWEHRSAIDTPRSVTAYLHAATRNRALNRVRDRATELRIFDRESRLRSSAVTPASTDAPDALAEASELSEALSRAVPLMPLRCREVFTLARTSHLTYPQIAVVLGLSPKTVEIHMSRALAFLRERLAPWLTG